MTSTAPSTRTTSYLPPRGSPSASLVSAIETSVPTNEGVRSSRASLTSAASSSTSKTDPQADPLSDYNAATGSVTFAPGETAETAAIQVVGDNLPEADEYFVVSFNNPQPASAAHMGGFWGLGFGVISNDDGT